MNRRVTILFAGAATLALATSACATPRRLHMVSSPVSAFPLVTPGSTPLGSWAPLAQPANQGSPGDFGYTQPAVGQWDLADYLDFTASQALCVYGKHLSGVNHVDFSVDGGAAVTAAFTAQSPNGPEPAYCVSLDPTTTTDRNFEARAVVYPNSGVPLVLQGAPRKDVITVASLYGTSNGHGTMFSRQYFTSYLVGVDSPTCGADASHACASISQSMQNAMVDGGDMGGATVCLMAGPNWVWFGDTNSSFVAAHRYVNFQPCPGVTKAQVTITDADNAHGVRVDKQHLAHVNWISQGSGSTWNTFGLGAAFGQDVNYVGRGTGLNDQFMSGGRSSTFALDLDVSKTGDGWSGSLGVRIHNHDIDSDGFSGAGAIFDDPNDATDLYNVEATYTPPGSAVYVTGDTHATTTIDNISNTSKFNVGSRVFDSVGATPCFPVASIVTSIAAHSIQVSPAPTCTESGAILTTASHADVYQMVELNFEATGTAGSNTITVTPGTGTPFVGGVVWDNDDLPTTAASPFPSPHLAPFTRVTAYDSNTGIATLSNPVQISFTARGLYTGRNNNVLYGVRAVNWVNAQGIFQGADMTGFVADHVTINTATLANQAAGETLYNWHSGGHWQNSQFDTVNFLGMPSASSLQAQDFLIKNTTCFVISADPHTGITYSGGTTCKFP